ncbi:MULTISPECIES: GNAT family N-acetyltransferase [unclassified Streptomyces]|uniref:GNAT family N-acetyltransferase n=1 Tax=unclassified Streptomyces TaxID=2593676 RepID=UPI001F1ED08D|nr:MULTISPECIES: GNAT family N-acetyltransferase [unclassified Streptomyces]
MAFVDVDQALSGEWRAFEGEADLVRVQDPPEESWPALKKAGFLPKPQVVAWRAEALASEEEYLRSLSGKDRYDVRAAYRRASEASLQADTEPLTERLLDEFLELYRRQVALMSHGWAVAVEQRASILAEAASYHAVTVRFQGELVGACLNQELSVEDEVRARFSAVTSGQRHDSLGRVLYWETLRRARERKRRWVSLGRDINLYGHVCKPGLFSFKSRLGFTAIPGQTLEPGSGSHQADRVVRFSELSDPTLLLTYSSVASEKEAVAAPLHLDVFTSSAELDVRPYRGVDLAGTTIHRTGPS